MTDWKVGQTLEQGDGLLLRLDRVEPDPVAGGGDLLSFTLVTYAGRLPTEDELRNWDGRRRARDER